MFLFSWTKNRKQNKTHFDFDVEKLKSMYVSFRGSYLIELWSISARYRCNIGYDHKSIHRITKCEINNSFRWTLWLVGVNERVIVCVRVCFCLSNNEQKIRKRRILNRNRNRSSTHNIFQSIIYGPKYISNCFWLCLFSFSFTMLLRLMHV